MTTFNAYHDCTISGLHMWAKHLVENVGWIMMAQRHASAEKASGSNFQVNSSEERVLYVEKIEGFVASVKLLRVHLARRLAISREAGATSDTTRDLEILMNSHLELLEHVVNMVTSGNAQNGSKSVKKDVGLYGGKRGSKKSSKSSKSTKPKKASKGKKGSKKSV